MVRRETSSSCAAWSMDTLRPICGAKPSSDVDLDGDIEYPPAVMCKGTGDTRHGTAPDRRAARTGNSLPDGDLTDGGRRSSIRQMRRVGGQESGRFHSRTVINSWFHANSHWFER